MFVVLGLSLLRFHMDFMETNPNTFTQHTQPNEILDVAQILVCEKSGPFFYFLWTYHTNIKSFYL